MVLWGDHGYHMGEHDWWGGKHNTCEEATRVPLLVAAPSMKAPGKKTPALVGFVDLYPSLAELAGLPAPVGVEGTNFKPLLDDPARPWKKAAFSQYPKGGNLGITMRTDRYRYAEWADKAGKVVARELYDHQTDPQENQNLADKAALVEELAKQLHAGWKAAQPSGR